MTDNRLGLRRCVLCGDFHMLEACMSNQDLCHECVIAVTHMRSAWESRGGTVVIDGDKIAVRTKAQLNQARLDLTDFIRELER